MAKDVIHTDGEDVVVREDTAKAFRGVNWALISVAAFIIIVAVLFMVFFFGSAADGSIETPARINN
jgi:flagellar basal body-associated protein FliL